MSAWAHTCALVGFAVMLWLSVRASDHSVAVSLAMLLATGFLFGYLLL
jgi:FtsH-binding integral membrane protein